MPRHPFFVRPNARTRHPRRRPRVRVPDDAPQTDAIFILVRRLRAPLIYMISVMALAVVGLTIVPGKDANGNVSHISPFDAFYFITYTASTIGFGEIVPLTTPQRMWMTLCIFLTVIGWAYLLGTLMGLLQSPSFQEAVKTQRFRTKVKHIREPFLIVCGYGQTGRQVCRELDIVGRRMVVIDDNEERVASIGTDALQSEVTALDANAGLPGSLGIAGLDNEFCEGVLALTDDDTDNLAIVMAATLLRPDIQVIARCMDRTIEDHMRNFSPTAVINPSDAYGAYLVLALQRPATFRLVTWLMDPGDLPLPRAYEPVESGARWVVCADGEFADEITNDLRRAGMEVTLVGPDDAPDLADAHGYVAGTQNDTINLALAERAKLDRPDLFVAVRQHSGSRAALVAALDIDSVFTPTELVAQESLARVITPLFWSFIDHAVSQENEFSENLIGRLTRRCGANGKDRALIDLTASGAPALHRLLVQQPVTIGDLLRCPDDREESLPLVALVLIRDGEHIYAPDETTTVTPDDQLLFVGTSDGLDDLRQTLVSDSVAEYVVNDRQVPETWVWRRLTREHRHRAEAS